MSVFGVQNDLKMFFWGACFQVIFLSISKSTFQCLGLPNRGFRIEGIAIIDFLWKLFLMNLGIDFYRFLTALGGRFSDFFSLENRLENEGTFCDETDPEMWIWWIRSPRYSG